MKYESREELASKIDYEGGLEEFLRYGFSVDDIPEDDDELYQVAAQMMWDWEDYKESAENFMRLLPDSWDA